MADVTDYQTRMANVRTEFLNAFDENPKIAAAHAFDALTELLIGVIDELRETRLRGPQHNA